LVTNWRAILGSGYEIVGGLLIFGSSAVSETAVPKDKRRNLWVVFGIAAIIYIVFGIGIRIGDVKKGIEDKAQADRDRQDLRDLRTLTDSRTSSVLYSFGSMYATLQSLKSDLDFVKAHQGDPNRVAQADSRMQQAKNKADKLTQELLAITMAPQVAEQLRDWNDERQGKQNEISARQEMEEMQTQQAHPDDKQARSEVINKWAAITESSMQEYQDKLKALMTTGDFISKEMLKLVPTKSPEDDKDFMSRSRENAAWYLENLAKRIPAPQ
jgi:hypothetical protein